MKHSVMMTLFLLVLFFGAQLIGLKITQSYIDLEKSKEAGVVVWKGLPEVAGLQVERPDVTPAQSIWYIGIAIAIGTIIILIIVRLKTMLLWKLWFYGAIVMCLEVAFAAFMPGSYALVLALIVGIFKVFKPNVYVHNLSELFVYGGLAAIFVPILNVFYGFLLLLVLSVYDMYAVWKSEHMITMAKFQADSGMFAGLFIPYAQPAIPSKPSKSVKLVKGKVKTAVLGGGDIGFPLLFAGTILATKGFVAALIISCSATVALLLLLLLSKKDRFYPAMPFLTAGCAAGYLLTLVV